MKKTLLFACVSLILNFQFSIFNSLQAQDYDFSAKVGGNTLYFYITNTATNTVEVAYPGPSEEEPWKGARKPHGHLSIPETVEYDSVLYKVTAIRYFAFAGCDKITLLVIPSGIQEIGEGAFAGCKNIKNIVSTAIVPPRLDESTFDGVPLDIPVKVPAGTYRNYQQAEGWRMFTEIIEF